MSDDERLASSTQGEHIEGADALETGSEAAGLPRHPAEVPTAYLGGPARMGSRFTFWLGAATLGGLAAVAVLGLLSTPADDVQGDAVRIIYVHVPAAAGAYAAFVLTAVGSIMWLWRRSAWWDIVAHAGAEIGSVLCGLTLATGMLWGRPTWGTYWEWGDVRLVTTLILLLVMVGYLSVRAMGGEPAKVATRAAVIGLVGAVNMPIVNRSVDWWANRTLHQRSSVAEGNIEGLTLFTLFAALMVTATAMLWMVIHRFRIGWLERQIRVLELDEAIAARHAESVP